MHIVEKQLLYAPFYYDRDCLEIFPFDSSALFPIDQYHLLYQSSGCYVGSLCILL